MDHLIVLKSGRKLLRKVTSLLRQRRRLDESGAAAVEFGIVALPFFTMVFAIIQIALVFMADQVLESAVADAARMIKTGQSAKLGAGLSANMGGGTGANVGGFNAQVCSELYYLLDCTQLQTFITTASTFGSINSTPPVNATTGAYNATPSYSAAANTASQIVVITTYYEYTNLFSALGLSIADQPNGTRLLGATAAFRNEPFP